MENYNEEQLAQKQRVDFLADLLKEAYKEKRELKEHLNLKQIQICKIEDQFQAENAKLQDYFVEFITK